MWDLFFEEIGMLWWRTTCLVTMMSCIGTWILLDWCTIGEVDFKSSIFNALYSVRMGQGDDDKFGWIRSERRYFEVKTFNIVHPTSDFSFYCKSI